MGKGDGEGDGDGADDLLFNEFKESLPHISRCCLHVVEDRQILFSRISPSTTSLGTIRYNLIAVDVLDMDKTVLVLTLMRCWVVEAAKAKEMAVVMMMVLVMAMVVAMVLVMAYEFPLLFDTLFDEVRCECLCGSGSCGATGRIMEGDAVGYP